MTLLTDDDRAALLRLARSSIHECLTHDGTLRAVLDELPRTRAIEQTRGAFVSLKKPTTTDDRRGYALRGCIGSIGSADPLYRNVIRNAERAALNDPRFEPLPLPELEGIRIEISALTALTPVAGPEDLVIGRDGVQLERDGARSVFLPQVAEELGWGRDEWLSQLSIKAGLSRNAWKAARLSSFQAEVFGEPRN